MKDETRKEPQAEGAADAAEVQDAPGELSAEELEGVAGGGVAEQDAALASLSAPQTRAAKIHVLLDDTRGSES